MSDHGIDAALRVLLLPGWLDSGPGHWHTRWQARHGIQRVQQDDWPERLERLERLRSLTDRVR